jgi:Lysyl oxidase
MRRLVTRLLPALAAIGVMIPAAIAAGGDPPVGEPLLPDLDQEVPTDLQLTRAGKQWRLGFRSAVRNVGDGPLIIDGRRPDPGQSTMAASQVIENSEGPLSEVSDAGSLRYVRSPDHQHWHLLRFDRYELRRPGGGEALIRDRKTGFCLGDRYEVTSATEELPAKAPEEVYTSRCGLEQPGLLGIREGISVGWGDDYSANLEGQYLPLNRLRNGRYLLVHRVNGDRRIRESSYENNASSTLLRLRWRHGAPRIRVIRYCATSERCAA